MELLDTICTLEVRWSAGHDVAQELSCAYAEMCVRKHSQRSMWGWYSRLSWLLTDEKRHMELIEAGNGVDPDQMGWWRDAQDAVQVWLAGHAEYEG